MGLCLDHGKFEGKKGGESGMKVKTKKGNKIDIKL